MNKEQDRVAALEAAVVRLEEAFSQQRLAVGGQEAHAVLEQRAMALESENAALKAELAELRQSYGLLTKATDTVSGRLNGAIADIRAVLDA